MVKQLDGLTAKTKHEIDEIYLHSETKKVYSSICSVMQHLGLVYSVINLQPCICKKIMHGELL